MKHIFISSKKHLPYIGGIVLLAILVFYNFFSLYDMPLRTEEDWLSYNGPNMYIVRESLLNKDIPLWNPRTMGGSPFFAKPQIPVIYFSSVFLLLANAWLGLKLSVIFHFIIAGLGMYLLMIALKKEERIAFISAIAYMFSGYIWVEMRAGHTNAVYAYAWIPFIVLFLVRAFREKNWLANSILAGIFFSFQLLGGGPQEFMNTILLFGAFLALMSIGRRFPKRLVKTSLIGIAVVIVLLGMVAFKILPGKEILGISVRNAGYSYEDAVGDPVQLKEMFHDLAQGGPRAVGLAVFALACFSLFDYKKKNTLIFWGLAIFSLFIVSGSFIYYWIWKYIPLYRSIDDVWKGIFLFSFPASVLAGIGSSVVLSKLEKKFKLSRNYLNIAWGAIIILILVNLIAFGQGKPKMANLKEQIEQNQIMQYMAKDNDLFRFHVYETNGIDWSTEHYSVPLGLQDVYGTENIWLIDYLPIYLSLANSQPAKLFGVLNTKYLTAMEPLNISGFRFVKKFEECRICLTNKSDGPYLYENELFLPRAYFADYAVLVVGEDESAKQLMLYLMANPGFDPSNTVIIKGKGSINDYSPDFLEHFNAIVLAKGSIDQNSAFILEGYAKNRGILIPDVIKGEQSFSEEKITGILASFKGDYSKVKKAAPQYDTYDKANFEIRGNKGFLVLSEQYSMYPGWNAYVDGKKADILRANGVLTAIYAEGNNVFFEYLPKSFVKGSIITIATLLLIILYFVYPKINIGKRYETKH